MYDATALLKSGAVGKPDLPDLETETIFLLKLTLIVRFLDALSSYYFRAFIFR